MVSCGCGVENVITITALSRQIDGVEGVSRCGERYHDHCLVQTDRRGGGSVKVWRTLSRSLPCPDRSTGWRECQGVENVITITALSRQIDGVEGVSRCGERYHDHCLVQTDRRGGGSVMVWRTLSRSLPCPDRSMGWRECHGVENVITITALSRQIDGVEGVSRCGERYHDHCLVQTDRWGGGSVMVWRTLSRSLPCPDRSTGWRECHGVENVITITALSRQIDGVEGVSRCGERYHDHCLVQTDRRGGGSVKVWRTLSRSLPCSDRSTGWRECHGVENVITITALSRQIDGVEGVSWCGERYHDHCLVQTDRRGGGSVMVWRTLSRSLPCSDRSTGWRECQGVENVITITALSRQIDGVEGVSWCGERYHDHCLVQTDRRGGGSVKVWRTLSRSLPCSDRSTGWRECQGVENVITITALFRQIDGVEGVSWCGERYHDHCLVQTDRRGGGSVKVWRTLSRSLPCPDRSTGWRECHGVENVITITALFRQIDGVEGVSRCGERYHDHCLVQTDRRGGGSVKVWRTLSRSLPCPDRSTGWRECQGVENVITITALSRQIDGVEGVSRCGERYHDHCLVQTDRRGGGSVKVWRTLSRSLPCPDRSTGWRECQGVENVITITALSRQIDGVEGVSRCGERYHDHCLVQTDRRGGGSVKVWRTLSRSLPCPDRSTGWRECQGVENVITITALSRQIDGVEGVSRCGERYHDHCLVQTDRRGGGSVKVWRTLSRSLPCPDRSTGWRECHGVENVITITALSRQIDGVEGVSWCGERYHDHCLVQTDRRGGGSVKVWKTLSRSLPCPDRSTGWRECHGVENVITITALSRQIDGVEGVSWCGERYHDHCLVQTDRRGGGSVKVWRTLSRSLPCPDRSTGWRECQGVENVITITALSRQIDGVEGVSWCGERYHDHCLVQTDRWGGGSVMVWRTLSRSLPCPDRSTGWRECHGVENVITITALSRQIDGVEGVSWCGERYHDHCLVQTDRWGGGSVMVWRTLSRSLPCSDRSTGWRECQGVENVITITALFRQIDGVEGVSRCGERYHDYCLVQTDRWGGGSVMVWRTLSRSLPCPDRSTGWRECHGMENVITITALFRQIDGVEGVSWCGERYHDHCLVQTDRRGGGSVMVWRTLSRSLPCSDRSMGWRECHGVENVITITALFRQIDGVEGVSWYGERYHDHCLVQTDRRGGGSVMVWRTLSRSLPCPDRSTGWRECHGVENVITITALFRQIDGVEGVSWCGERYHDHCLVQTDRRGGGSVMVWRTLSRSLPCPDRSTGWRECHGVENVITITALFRQIDGVEGVSWCGERYHDHCLVQTDRRGGGSVKVWRTLSRSLPCSDRSTGWRECHGVENVITITALFRQIDGVEGVSRCGERYHDHCLVQTDRRGGGSVKVWRTLSRSLPCSDRSTGWRECHGVENVITITALFRQIDGVEGVSWCGERYHDHCLVQTDRRGGGSVKVWRTLSRSLPCSDRSMGWRECHGVEGVSWCGERYHDHCLVQTDRWGGGSVKVWRECHGEGGSVMVWRECHGEGESVKVWRECHGEGESVMVWRECHGVEGVSWCGGSVMVWRECHGEGESVKVWRECHGEGESVMVWRECHGVEGVSWCGGDQLSPNSTPRLPWLDEWHLLPG